MTTAAYAMLFWMLVGHAIADYPLQGDWLSKAKNHTLELVPGEAIWPLALSCHTLIHAGAVILATGSYIVGAIELFLHWQIDYAKCSGRLTYNQDQLLHVLCKCVYAGVLALLGTVPWYLR
jgi:hypothetical protein